MRVAGFVLAGGKSRRMRIDKALLPYKETVLVEWVFRQVEKAAGQAFLVGSPGRYDHLNLPVVEDRIRGCGPLGGIHAALALGIAEWNLVVACDMPGLEVSWLERIVRETGKTAADAVVTRDLQGRPEPLCAAYHERLRERSETALERRRFAVRDFLQDIDVVWLTVASQAALANVNTPEEWALWQS